MYLFICVALFLTGLPAVAQGPFTLNGRAIQTRDFSCDVVIYDKGHLWGWCTVYTGDGKTCKGKFWRPPNAAQIKRAVEEGEAVEIPTNWHPTDPEEIAAVGGLKPFPAVVYSKDEISKLKSLGF